MVNTALETIFGRVHQHRHRLGLIVVVIPMVLVSLYYVVIATERYVSESRVVVKHSATDSNASIGGISLPFLGNVGASSNEDALHLQEFLRSPDLLAKLDKELGLRKEFALKGLDLINTLPPWASREDFLDLFRKRVEVEFDDKSGILTIRTIAESPEFAQRLNQAILKHADQFINELSQHIAQEATTFASNELERARKGLDLARDEMLGYQNENRLLDPTATASATSGLVAELEGQLAAKEVELTSLSGMLQDTAPQIVSLRQGIVSLRRQIDVEKRKLTSPQGQALNRAAAQFLDYKAMVDFHADIYKVSLAAFEKIRVESVRKVRALAIIASPQLAEEYAYPRRTLALGSWLFVLCMLYGLIKLTVEIVEDHRD